MYCNKYGEKILATKKQHWTDYLEDMTATDIWTANKYLKELVGDGGSPRILTLRFKDGQGRETQINNSKDKADILAKLFFPHLLTQ